jgi:hypothetical protein
VYDLEDLVVDKIDIGPCTSAFGEDYLGRTKGETQFNYGVETYSVETEEDGVVDEVIINDALTVTIPLIYSDVETLALIIPWATIKTDSSGNKRLAVGKAIGTRLAQYAKKLTIHPEAMGDSDHSKDLTIHKCYPKPGPLNFNYARSGERIANIQFVAMRDSSKPAGEDYFSLGDPSISADTTPPTVSSTLPVDDATGVAKASGITVDFVMSEDMDDGTIIKANTNLINLDTGVPMTDYTVSYVAASKTVRLTTSATLTGTNQYAAILGTGVKDVAGNALAAPKVVTFTTAS